MFENYKTINGFRENIETICRDLNIRNNGKTEPNLTKWIDNEPQGKLINDKEEFDDLFKLKK